MLASYNVNATEEWLPVVGYERFYQVSNIGRVRRIEGRMAGCLMKPAVNQHGYVRVNLRNGETQKARSIHSLVAAAFIGPRPEGHEINHKDGNKLNNVVGNLEYVTPSANKAHALANGLLTTKLSPQQVASIKAHPKFVKPWVIAGMYGVSAATVQMIRRGQIWRDIEPGPRPTIKLGAQRQK